MKRLFLVFLGGVAGYIAGYFADAEVACEWLIPPSNLCGIYGVFLTGPIGFAVGITVACRCRVQRRAEAMNERGWRWIAFLLTFVAVGVPYWVIPYNKINLPDAFLTRAFRSPS